MIDMVEETFHIHLAQKKVGEICLGEAAAASYRRCRIAESMVGARNHLSIMGTDRQVLMKRQDDRDAGSTRFAFVLMASTPERYSGENMTSARVCGAIP